jgi:DNA-binding SARP family transcriptional activator/TolB-like protein
MISLRLLGGVSLSDEEGAVTGPATQRRRLALLAVLSASPSGTVSRDKLIGYFWAEEETDRARHFLADSLFTLRKSIGKDAIRSIGDDVQIDRTLVECDVARFRDALARGDREAAVELYRGLFLDGFFVSDAPEFDRWVDGERARLADLYALALEELAGEAELRGERERAVRWWGRLAAYDPYSSRVAMRLMQALAATGDRARAMQHARVHAALLREELQAGPDPEVEALAAQLAQPPAPTAAPASVSATAVGTDPGLPLRPPGSETDPAAAVSAEPLAPSAPRRQPRTRSRSPGVRVTALALLAFVSAIVVTGLVMDNRPEARPAARTPAGPTVLAVLPFSVRGGTESAYLREGMVTLLGTSLNGASDLRVVDSNALLSHLAEELEEAPLSPAAAAAVVREFGAELFVLGTVVEAGGRTRIAATLYRDGPSPVPVLEAVAEGSDIYALVDEISRQVLAGRLQSPADQLSRLALRTTSSLDALKAYLKGEREFRAARYEPAAASFRRAVRADPQFALAYYRLSTSEEWSFHFVEARQAAERALRLSERLQLHDQLLISAWRAFVTGDAEEAERLYESIVAENPFDVEAWSGIGEVRVHYAPVLGRSIAEAVPAFDHVLRLAPNYGETRFHLMEFAAQRADTAAFDSLLAGVDRTSQQLLSWQAARAVAWGSPAEADAFARQLRDTEDVVVGIAAVRAAAHFREPGRARMLARVLTQPGRPASWRAAGQVILAQCDLAVGDWRGADAALDTASAFEQGWALEVRALGALLPDAEPDAHRLRELRDRLAAWDPGRATPETAFFFAIHADVHPTLRLYLLALLSTRLGDGEAAERYANALRSTGRSPEGRELVTSLLRSVDAHRAWARGDAAEALRILEQQRATAPLERIALSPFFALSLDRYLRAEALRALGRPREALRWYSSLIDGPDILFWAPAQRRRREVLALIGSRGGGMGVPAGAP